MKLCPICQGQIKGKTKYCSRNCVRKAYSLGLVKNSGPFKKGAVSLNKGRTFESWVGEDRARPFWTK